MKHPENNPLNNTVGDRDRKLKDTLGETTNLNNLAFDKDKNSYSLDTPGDDPEYIHEDPYDSTAENGRDDNSDWDEANPYVGNEYDKNASLETDLEDLDMHIDTNGDSVKVDPIDEKLAHTPEDDRDDLDEEGYPRNDQDIAGGKKDDEML